MNPKLKYQVLARITDYGRFKRYYLGTFKDIENAQQEARRQVWDFALEAKVYQEGKRNFVYQIYSADIPDDSDEQNYGDREKWIISGNSERK